MKKTFYQSILLFLLLITLLTVLPGLAEENTAIEISGPAAYIMAGKQMKLTATVNTKDVPQKTAFIWESDHPEIAKVANGNITGISAGTATIKATAKDDPKVFGVYEIEVRTPVKALKINPAKTQLAIGAAEDQTVGKLTAIVEPENAYYQKVTWKSSNENILTITKDGEIKAHAVGTATVTVFSEEPGSKVKAVATVSVGQAVEKITLNQTSGTVAAGKTISLKAFIEPSNASNKKIIWKSSDESIATVTPKGQVKGISNGTVTISAVSEDTGTVISACEIQVVSPVKKITVAQTKLTLATGVNWKQDINITPADATIKEINWKSSDDTVATVDSDGTIHAIGKGKAKLTGTAADGSKVKVTVPVEVKNHDVIISKPGECEVPFDTINSTSSAGMQIGRYFWGTIWKTTVKYSNDCVKSVEEKNKILIPQKPGSVKVSIKETENGRVTHKETHLVFVTQDALN